MALLTEAWKSSEVSTELISGRLFAQRCRHHRLQPPPRRPGARHVIIQFMDEKMAEDNRLRTAARFMSAVLNTYCLVPEAAVKFVPLFADEKTRGNRC